ncbi:AAA family ATPase [Mycobacterium yunnanensis]|uniref:AAA family ATPase n=1 Tax=Mycobacterium yunnanensis TaxID=368477 RepID=A0A9X2YP66_9MYCO|nr:LuxR family transcriptional regulator [Mycobacterium yunnanensis]MCV7423027.1 AAA family ATPase [Mycobacterium yunnanensis]
MGRSTSLVGREAEAQAIADFLSGTDGSSALAIEGEPGIGKTTLWLAGCDLARELGCHVMSARAADAESVLAYTPLADLLRQVDRATLATLPRPQRSAVDQVLVTADTDTGSTDQRAVAAGLLSVVEALAESAPVLLAVDDLQWLDPSSALVLGYVVRRLPRRARVLATVRSDPRDEGAASWLQSHRPDAVTWIRLEPLRLNGINGIVREHTGRYLPRPALVRIHELSGGNPFYALELARVVDPVRSTAATEMPSTLTDVVRARIGEVDPAAGDALLAAACLAAPTVDLIADAVDVDVDRVVELLEGAESQGVVVIDGGRVRFAHPLLAHGFYTDVAPARRRRMHRRLAAVVAQPELRARHLALSSTSRDDGTLRALDAAAEASRVRGAPAAAAELVDMAIGLGGDTAQRRIKLAQYHFDAGNPSRARELLDEVVARLPRSVERAAAASLLGVVLIFGDSLPGAVDVLRAALDDVEDDLALRVDVLTALSFTLLNVGDVTAAVRTADEATAHAELLGQPHRSSQAVGMRVMVRFLAGDGLDGAGLRRALTVEDHPSTPMAFRPSTQHAMLLAWTGQLERSAAALQVIGQDCVDRGDDGGWMFIAFNSLVTHVWRGTFAEAGAVAEDAMERALLMGGDVMLSAALTMRATVAVYAGRIDEARAAADQALAASDRAGSSILAGWPIALGGFLELSVGNYEGTLARLEPLLVRLWETPWSTEIFLASFVPDAVEAMVALGRLDDAEPLVDVLEDNGRRLDRAWMLAAGGRCRALLLAARGDVTAAAHVADVAMTVHDRLPMPFERARTQLVVGQLQRRQRRNVDAARTLREAIGAFEGLGTALWADRTRAELERVNVGPHAATRLTASERRVAELISSGMTNRAVAAALFISPKTVEANLSHVYRKLGIRSRAELGQRMARLDE